MSIVAVIPARGGSKGIHRKNLVQIAGRPLIYYSIEASRNAASVDRVLISTDDSEIADVARELGAEVPFLRPRELAGDASPMLGVMQHALHWLVADGEPVEAILLLQPTSPLRTVEHIDSAINLFKSSDASSVVSVVEVPHRFHPESVMKLTPHQTLAPFHGESAGQARRQDKPTIYARNGPSVLVCHRETLIRGELYGNRCIPFLMRDEESLDIDTPEDLLQARRILSRQNMRLN